jgi:hypothetical protein
VTCGVTYTGFYLFWKLPLEGNFDGKYFVFFFKKNSFVKKNLQISIPFRSSKSSRNSSYGHQLKLFRIFTM